MPFNNDNIKQIRAEIEQALEAVAKKHKLTISLGKVTYYSDHFTAKVEGREANAPSKEAQLYEVSRERYGLPPLGATVVLSGKELMVSGMTPRGKVVLTQGDKEYTADVSAIVRAAPKQPPKLSLEEFVDAVNQRWTDGRKGAAALPALMLDAYHRSGMTPEAAIATIEENSRRDMRAETRAS